MVFKKHFKFLILLIYSTFICHFQITYDILFVTLNLCSIDKITRLNQISYIMFTYFQLLIIVINNIFIVISIIYIISYVPIYVAPIEF